MIFCSFPNPDMQSLQPQTPVDPCSSQCASNNYLGPFVFSNPAFQTEPSPPIGYLIPVNVDYYPNGTQAYVFNQCDVKPSALFYPNNNSHKLPFFPTDSQPLPTIIPHFTNHPHQVVSPQNNCVFYRTEYTQPVNEQVHQGSNIMQTHIMPTNTQYIPFTQMNLQPIIMDDPNLNPLSQLNVNSTMQNSDNPPQQFQNFYSVEEMNVAENFTYGNQISKTLV